MLEGYDIGKRGNEGGTRLSHLHFNQRYTSAVTLSAYRRGVRASKYGRIASSTTTEEEGEKSDRVNLIRAATRRAQPTLTNSDGVCQFL